MKVLRIKTRRVAAKATKTINVAARSQTGVPYVQHHRAYVYRLDVERIVFVASVCPHCGRQP